MHPRIASLLFLALTVAGCNAIPELRYEPDLPDASGASDATGATDAHFVSADGTSVAPLDAKTDDDKDAETMAPEGGGPSTDAEVRDAPPSEASTPDASISDTGPADAATPDAGPLSCPAGPPPGASICCGSVPCSGASSSCLTECTNCKNNCGGKTCCLDQNGNFHGCADVPANCPN